MKAYKVRRVMAPLILDFVTRWMLWQTSRLGCVTHGEFSGYKPCIT